MPKHIIDVKQRKRTVDVINNCMDVISCRFLHLSCSLWH